MKVGQKKLMFLSKIPNCGIVYIGHDIEPMIVRKEVAILANNVKSKSTQHKFPIVSNFIHKGLGIVAEVDLLDVISLMSHKQHSMPLLPLMIQSHLTHGTKFPSF
jgi:hypothetical protein